MKKTFSLLLIVTTFIDACNNKHSHPVVTTFAGSGLMGSVDGKGKTASFSNMMGIAADSKGNIYVADSHNNLIRRINPNGIVKTFAGSNAVGSADGPRATASFFNPEAVAVDRKGNVYVADTHNNLIRKISEDGVVTTIAGRRENSFIPGKDSSARFDNPSGIAVDLNGNLYVADWANNLIRKISPGGKVTNLAGSGIPGSNDGIGSSASFYLPWGIAVDSANNVYVADSYNNMIRKISPEGVVKTLAGKKEKGVANGSGSNASFFHPAGIALDKQDNIYVADMGNNIIRKISPNGIVITLAGNGVRGAVNGSDTAASFYKPYGVALDQDGNVYVADYQNNLIRKISF